MKCSTPSSTSARPTSSPWPGQTHKNAHGELVGNVTIATNMAGRGTDIKPAPETFFDVTSGQRMGPAANTSSTQRGTGKTVRSRCRRRGKSAAAGLPASSRSQSRSAGLHVIGTERHTARRIDNQLRGRSRPPGRSGLQPVLRLAGRRADEDVRRRVDHQGARLAGHGRGDGHRGQAHHQGNPQGPEERSRSEISWPARTCSTTTK